MDFPILDLMDETACYQELLDLLHPDGLTCPHCGGGRNRYAVHRRRDGSPVVDSHCRDCRRVFNLFTGTPWQGTRRTPARILLILRGFTKGAPTAELARELKASHHFGYMSRSCSVQRVTCPSSCARRSDTPTRVVDTGNQSPKGAWTAKDCAAGPTEAPLGPESTQRIPRQIGRR